MSLNTYDLSAGVFIRGLTNVNTQLTKAEDFVVAHGRSEATFLHAQLATDGHAHGAPADLHGYTLAAHVYWAAEGAMLAVTHVLGTPATPTPNDATRFADLHQRLDATIEYLRAVRPTDLEAGLDRTIVIERPRGALRASGRQFLLAYAIPHFFYHVTTVYGILRNQGVHLTMGDFLGTWTTS